jgi:hypothetical protein
MKSAHLECRQWSFSSSASKSCLLRRPHQSGGVVLAGNEQLILEILGGFSGLSSESSGQHAWQRRVVSLAESASVPHDPSTTAAAWSLQRLPGTQGRRLVGVEISPSACRDFAEKPTNMITWAL